MHNTELFSWREHYDVGQFSANLASLLDLLTELFRGDAQYFHFATRKGCDIFDFETMLRFADHEGIIDLASRAAWQEGMELASSRPSYMTVDEVQKRLTLANGSCPFCGDVPSFYERYAKGIEHVMGHCHHLTIGAADDPETALRRPRVWEGYRWPYDFTGRLLAKSDGSSLRDRMLSAHCIHCRKQDAVRRLAPKVQAVLTDLLAASRQAQYASFGSSPLTAITCPNCNATGAPCEHEARKINMMTAQILNDEQSEFKLNGAGLKLYSRGVHVSHGFSGDVSFSMRVSPLDQGKDYPAFVSYATERIAADGLKEHKITRAGELAALEK